MNRKMEVELVNKEKYLKLLAKTYPTRKSCASEIINLRAKMNLPKGTEYFFSDLHGEHEAFIHLLRSASGNIRSKITGIFDGRLSEEDQNRLANLVYDPEEVITLVKRNEAYDVEWQRKNVYRLVELAKKVASKYSRSKVRTQLPEAYAYIIDELMNVDSEEFNKKDYYNQIIASIIETDATESFIIAISNAIKSISVDSLHIIGDIYDRGPRPDLIMDALMEQSNVDIQWGNHDIAWMGAAAGSEALIANVVRVGIRYNNYDLMEDGYGINLRALSSMAAEVYANDDGEKFMPRIYDESEYDHVPEELSAKMHKAITVVQFKLEGQLIERNPEWGMEDRNVFRKIDWETMEYIVDEVRYPMTDTFFPTVDPIDPLALTLEEEEMMRSLTFSFKHSGRLNRHMRYLYSKGGTYKIVNSNLLYHGCLPMNADGTFQTLMIDGEEVSGKMMMDHFDTICRNAYFAREGSRKKKDGCDWMWYLWLGPISPMFGKSRMATFESYFIADKKMRKEVYNPYFKLIEKEETCDDIFEEFGLDPKSSHIINGHVPVKQKDGETPVKGNGKLYVIDGGIAKAYQKSTGIAGYTLIFNSHHYALAEHTAYQKIETDIGGYTPELHITEELKERLMVSDTDKGKKLEEEIEDLTALLNAYKLGEIKENSSRRN